MNVSERLQSALILSRTPVLEKSAFNWGEFVAPVVGAAKRLFGKGTQQAAEHAAEGAGTKMLQEAGQEGAHAAQQAAAQLPPLGPNQGYKAVDLGSGNLFWGKPSAEQLARGNRPGWSGMNPFRGRHYADDTSLARRLGKGLGFSAAGMGVLNTLMLPGQLQAAGEMGAARAVDQMRSGSGWDRFKRGMGLAFGSDDDILRYLAESNPNVAQNYWYMRQNQGKPQTWDTIYNSLLARPLQ